MTMNILLAESKFVKFVVVFLFFILNGIGDKVCKYTIHSLN